MATYQKVNLDVQPSSMPNGMDLPLNDINTLRLVGGDLTHYRGAYRGGSGQDP